MNVYEIITDKIIGLLEKGTVPWHKPWSGEAFAPCNLISQKAYRGVNAFLLSCMPYDSPYWLTFKQAQSLGGSVRKGEKSTPVIFWKWLEKEQPGSSEPEKVPLLRYYRVFHVTQCDLPEEKVPEPPEVTTYEFTPIAACEKVINEMPNRPEIKHDSHAAYYRPSEDTIHMPRPERFEKPEHYYGTIFHEAVHSTGAKSRLNRDGVSETAPFGSPTYSREELIAEFGAAFLCGHTGIETVTIENSAAYIQGWLKRLKTDSRLVIQAAANAQKAADYILNRKPFEVEAKE